MKDVFISVCSGLIGVLLTIGYQHFFGQPQSFTFINNGEEMIVTESNYTELIEQNKTLQNENHIYISDLEDANKKITELQNENNQLKQQYDNEINSKYDVDFQNIDLIINGIDSGYHDKVIVLDNETFYSQGFLQYIVDNQPLSFNNSKLFIGNVQSEDKMPVSLFELKPFTSGYSLSQTTYEKDNYDNVFSEVFKVRSGNWGYDDLMNNATEYFIDFNYSTLSFDYAYSQYASQGLEYEILIYGDGNLLESIILNRKSKIDHVDVNISNVEFLQIVGKSEDAHWGLDSCYSLIINPYLYP